MPDLSLTLDTSVANLNPEPLVPEPPRLLLTPLPTPGEFFLVIDNSSLEVFTTCPTSANYKLVLRREAHARNAALTFGGALHQGLEKFLEQQWGQKVAPTMADDHCDPSAQDQAILRHFTENPAPLDEYRTVTNALEVMKQYRMRASLPDYQWEIQSDANGPLIERAFELPLGTMEVNTKIDMPWLAQGSGSMMYEDIHAVPVTRIHIAWSGRIDAIARCGDGNRIRVVDHKTTSIMGDQFIQDFQISNQVLGYAWAARQLWPDLDVQGFCLNAIHFKKPTGNGSISAPGPRGGPAALNFMRAYFDYSTERMDQWHENCLAIVSDFIHCIVRDFYPRHSKWCFNKYGKCQYHDVCIQDDPKVRHNMLMSDMFKSVTWNPVAGR